MTVVIGGEVFRRGTGIYLWDMDNIFAYFTLILFFVHMVFLDRVVNKNNWFRSIIYGGTSVIIIFAVLGFILVWLQFSPVTNIEHRAPFIRHLVVYLVTTLGFAALVKI
ncbi:MAG: hypothetical protein MK212_11795 [Saprospiraceae bacterium]|nr:hypothetical protein [Saprospiraceae bacterium]